MKKYFFIVNSSLSLINFCLVLVSFYFFYISLPDSSDLKEKLQLGKRFKSLDLSTYFYDYHQSKVPLYDIIIDQVNYQKLLASVPKTSTMTNENKVYVAAKLLYNGEKYSIKLRLRGLNSNHWIDDKKSLRIRFSKRKLFHGKRDINLIIPEDRGYIVEHVSNFIAKKFKLIVPESEFVMLRMNGRYQGLYFETEQIEGQDFIEKNNRDKNSNIYNENNWDRSEFGDFLLFNNIGYWQKKSLESVSPFDNFAELDKLIELLHEPNDDIFFKKIPYLIDMDQFLKWQCHSMIMGSYHQGDKLNEYLYFNLSKGLFEVIPWDVNQFKLSNLFFDTDYNMMVTRILKNPEFRHQRNKILWSYVSDPLQLKEDLAFYDKTFADIKSAYFADTLKGYTNWRLKSQVAQHRDILKYNRDKIKKNLNFSKIYLDMKQNSISDLKTMIVDVTVDGMSAALLESLKFNPKRAQSLKIYYDSNQDGFFNDKKDRLLKTIMTLGKTNKEHAINFTLYDGRGSHFEPIVKKYRFFIISQNPIRFSDFVFHFKNAVTLAAIEPEIKTVDLRNFVHFNEIFLDVRALAQKHPFLKIENLGLNHVEIRPGTWIIDKTVIIPPQVQLTVGAGTILKFKKGISLISYGKVLSLGTDQKPIVITAEDKNNIRGTFAIVGNEADGSTFKNTIFEYGGDTVENGIFFSGGLSAHFIPSVYIDSCIFRYHLGGDALSVKNSTVHIENSLFHHNKSDGIDFDYSNGFISKNYFHDNGGDSIDLGGSSPEIVNNKIERSGDKGISVGEKSSPEIKFCVLSQNQIGIAVKNDSSFHGDNLLFSNNKFALQAYIKTDNYELGGMAKIENSSFVENKENFLITQGHIELTNCVVNGKKESFLEVEK